MRYQKLVKGIHPYQWTILLLICITLGINILVAFSISHDRYIYFWDYATYWTGYQGLRESMLKNPLQMLFLVYRSVFFLDYNYLPLLFLLPFSLLFGTSRLSYILAITNMFLIPSIILFGFLLQKITTILISKQTLLPFVIGVTLMSIVPQIYLPVLYGYIDVIGLVVIFIIFLVYIHYYYHGFTTKQQICIGILLAFLVLLRHIYYFWLIGFLLALFFDITLHKPGNFREIIKQIEKRIVIVFSCIIFLGIFANAINTNHLSTDYRTIFAPYRSNDNLLQQFDIAGIQLIHYFGLFTFAVFVAGICYALYSNVFRRLAIFLLIQGSCTFLLFSYIQDFGIQHYYLLLPTITLFIGILITKLVLSIQKLRYNMLFFIILVTLLFINFLMVFLPHPTAFKKIQLFLFSNAQYHPLTRNDLPEIRKILQTLDNFSLGKYDGIYVLASSPIMNGDLLSNACTFFHQYDTVCKHLLHTNDVDARDGFPKQLEKAKYIIVTFPIQYHLKPIYQTIIGNPSQQMLHSYGLGSHYFLLPYHFTLEEQVKVFIYEHK